MYKKVILMILVIGFLSCNPASADNLFTNGDFETGDLTGWDGSGSHGSGFYTAEVVCSGAGNGSDCGVLVDANNARYGWINQTIDLTNVDELVFDYTVVYRTGSSRLAVGFGDHTDIKWSHTTVGGWLRGNIDVSGYSGDTNIFFYAYGAAAYGAAGYFDNIVAEAVPPPAYIVWSTWPDDSWAVGNYSMIVVGLPRPPDPVDFYIKTPSTNYIKKPLTKSPLVKTWNYEESQWYYQYFHSVYHSQYGNYSCKIVNSSADFIEYNNITVPYSSPDVPIPPVVTIPTPDPIEAPPEWNVTIPEQYENVSWIFDYTVFWDEFGITLNDTLYSTVGLIFIPMESINESVYTVYTHVNTAADMVSGSEHTHVIVQVAWNVIPDSIKTIFIGAAAIGLCIFILHRRT